MPGYGRDTPGFDATPPDGFTPVGPVIQFSATAVENSEPVTSFKKPLAFELELSADDLAGITDPRKVGLYRLNDDGSLTFVAEDWWGTG